MNNLNFNSDLRSEYPNIFNRSPVDNQTYTNKWVVTSLQEALSRYAPPNSVGIYYNQDGKYEYEVYTDNHGIKRYETYERSLCSNEDAIQSAATKEDLQKLFDKITELEGRLNEQSNANVTKSVNSVQRPTDGKLNP